MKTILYAAFFALCAAAALPSFAGDVLMTAPRVPRAGQPTTIVFQAPALEYDLDPSTRPAASVAGNSIRIDLNAECDAMFCDLAQPRLFKTDLPALEQGEYQVGVFASAQASQSITSFAFSVRPEAPASLTRPAEGAWSNASRPGTGLHFQNRGPLLSVTQFDYSQERAQWRLDVSPLRGDSALILLRDYEDGSCFDCGPYYEPLIRLGGTPMLITFESARRARVELVDGTVVPVTSLPFGVDYVPIGATDPGDREFGRLPLPDVSGTWSVEGRITTFGPAVIGPGRVNFPPVSPDLTELECKNNQVDEIVCFMFDNYPPGGPILGVGPQFKAVARLGDVEENRIRMTRIAPPNEGAEFFMVRIPSTE